MAYAITTDVPFDRSISEIIALVRKAGAERIGQFDEGGRFTLQFTMADRVVRFRVNMPSQEEAERTRHRKTTARADAPAQWRRQRARALLLVIKAKLESVESDVETFEEAFLANVVMSDGFTVYERLAEPIALEYQSGQPSPMLLSGPLQ